MIRKAMHGNLGLLGYCAVSIWTCFELRAMLRRLEDTAHARDRIARQDPVARGIPDGSLVLRNHDGTVTIANVGTSWN